MDLCAKQIITSRFEKTTQEKEKGRLPLQIIATKE
jgi:hypothetical protein